MDVPALSVVIPNFNHAHHLPRCLEAMLGQSVQPAEIIVMDDASTDNSIEVIESFARRHSIVRLHRNERNLGVVVNVNLGIDLARGDYVFSAAADDEVVPGFFEKSLSLLAAHPEAALCCTIGDYRANTGLNWHWGVGVVEKPSYLSPARMAEVERKGRFYIPPHSVIFKKRALLEVGKYLPELEYTCDYFAMYVAGFRHGICFVPEPLAIFHINSESYYHRNRRNRQAHRQVVRSLLDCLLRPEFRDSVERIRDSGALHLCGWPVLRAALFESKYRWFLTPRLMVMAPLHETRIALKRILPAFLVNLLVRLAGHRARSVTASLRQAADTEKNKSSAPT